jgi:hypothetical protein
VTRACDQCGRPYEARRASSKYCSSTCRSQVSLNKPDRGLVTGLNQPMPATGIDPSTINPRWILAGIATDPLAPHAARVQACRTLMADAQPNPEEKALAALNQRTIEILNRRVH